MIHKKPFPLLKCRGLRNQLLEERKTLLKENSVCFWCVSSTAQQANNCKAVIQCSECGSNRHISALHMGPAPWAQKEALSSSTQDGREEYESPSSPVATSTCTEVCGDNAQGKSCSKICLVNVYPEGQPEKMKTYANLDDQSNKYLARSAFFKMFNVAVDASPYTLKTCAGISETMCRRARGFIVESADGKACLPLPTPIECNELPNNRADIPTADAARYHRQVLRHQDLSQQRFKGEKG